MVTILIIGLLLLAYYSPTNTFANVTFSLLEGFGTTCLLFALTLVLALPLGLAICFCTRSKFKPLRVVSRIFVWIIRGTPLMLQLFVVFYLPGLVFHVQLFTNRFVAALVAFVINYACYFSEIFRGGIDAVPRGQYEAGQVLGMKKKDVFFKVILLQLVKRILAPMSNEVTTLVKDTSLARVIFVVDILQVAENILMAKAIIWPIFYTGAFYLLFIGLVTVAFNKAEKKLSYFRV